MASLEDFIEKDQTNGPIVKRSNMAQNMKFFSSLCGNAFGAFMGYKGYALHPVFFPALWYRVLFGAVGFGIWFRFVFTELVMFPDTKKQQLEANTALVNYLKTVGPLPNEMHSNESKSSDLPTSA